MPLERLFKPVVVEDVAEREDGRMTVTVTFSSFKADQLKEAGGDDLKPLLTRLISKAVARQPGKPRRIVAHVPRDLLDRFDKYCEARGVTRSRALLARISRYVDEDGELLKKSYLNRMVIPDDSTTEDNRSEEHTSELQSRQYLVCRL